MLRRTGTVLFFSTNGACVYFTVVMKIFSHLLGHQSYSNAHYHNRGDGSLYSAKSTGMEWNYSVFTKNTLNCTQSGLNFINMGTFQSEIVIQVSDTHYMVLISLVLPLRKSLTSNYQVYQSWHIARNMLNLTGAIRAKHFIPSLSCLSCHCKKWQNIT